MAEITTRHGRPWDHTYTYDHLDTYDIVTHYLPPSLQHDKRIRIANLHLVDKDDTQWLTDKLQEWTKEDKDKLLIELTINSPKGNRYANSPGGELIKHSVALVIDLKHRRIEYQDPYGLGIDERETDKFRPGEIEGMPSLKGTLSQIFPGFDYVESRQVQQQDKASCGPITIHNLITHAQTGAFDGAIDIGRIREQHAGILLAADAVRKDASDKQVKHNIHKIVAETSRKIAENYTVDVVSLDALAPALEALFWKHSVDSRNGGYSNLTDRKDAGILSKTGNNFVHNIYRILDEHLLQPQAGSHAGKLAGKPAAAIAIAKLDDADFQTRLLKAASASMVITISFGGSDNKDRE